MVRGSRERETEREEQGSQPRREQVERYLRRVYDETLNEPLPEELADLLERLKKQGGR